MKCFFRLNEFPLCRLPFVFILFSLFAVFKIESGEPGRNDEASVQQSRTSGGSGMNIDFPDQFQVFR